MRFTLLKYQTAPLNINTRILSIGLLIMVASISTAQTVQVIMGTNNKPITEFKYTYNDSTYTKTSGGGTTVQTTLPVDLISLKITDGTTKTLPFFNVNGAIISNNNFDTTVINVGVIDSGVITSAANKALWEPKMVDVASNVNILTVLLYDNVVNVPTGDDFDIRFVRGFTVEDYVVVGERDGNTNFILTPLDSLGNVITGGSKLHFGNTTGTTSPNGNNRYDWNTTFAPNVNQPMYLSVVDVELFGTTQTVFGFRVDNNGQADVKFFGLAETTFDDNPINLSIPGIIGTVYLDANGCHGDSTVNGISIDSAGNSSLYVSLLDNVGSIISTTAVDSNGDYQFLNSGAGTFSTVLHMNPAGSSTAALPANWTNTGEKNGSGTGNDGNANGVITSIVVADSLETNINFGIQQLPDSDNKSYNLSTSPVLNELRTLQASDGMGSLSGSDAEDGIKGAGNSFKITDTTGLNGNTLFYDKNVNGALDSGEELYADSVIQNYNPAKLMVKFIGMNSTDFTFDYATLDNANLQDPAPATYSAAWTSPLPVELLYFIVTQKGDIVELEWATASEHNNNRFEIYRSLNEGETFHKIGAISGAGDSRKQLTYSYADPAPLNNRTICYRLLQIDHDGSRMESEMACITSDLQATLSVFPNPAKNAVQISIPPSRAKTNVQLLSATGALIIDEQFNHDEKITLRTSELRNGIYLLKISSKDYIGSQKLIVRH